MDSADSFGLFFGGFYMIMICFSIISMLIGIVGIVGWILMLVDVIQRDEKDFPEQSKDQKTLWLLIMILGGYIGSIVYYFMVYKKQPRSK